jgi:hypothetical protein
MPLPNYIRKTLPFWAAAVILISIADVHAQDQDKEAIALIRMFDSGYGGPGMDAIAEFTTPAFRNNKPRSVWVMDTWKALNKIQYKRQKSIVMDTRFENDRAVVILDATIMTAAGNTQQKEIFYLVKENNRWLIDDLMITGENIDADDIKL